VAKIGIFKIMEV